MSKRRLARLTLPALIGLLCVFIIGCAPSGIASPTSERVIFTPTLFPTFTSAPIPSPLAPTPTGTFIPTITPTPAPEPTPTGVAEGLTITIVYDNNRYDERLETAWGFSCLVEGLEKTILFDTGGDSAMLLRNMSKLRIDPQSVDVIVISHIHCDHLGGLSGLLEENNNVTVYLPQSLPESIKNTVREQKRDLSRFTSR